MHRRDQNSETVYDSRALTQADENALIQAAKDGNDKEVLRLLDKGVNINFKDRVSASIANYRIFSVVCLF